MKISQLVINQKICILIIFLIVISCNTKSDTINPPLFLNQTVTTKKFDLEKYHNNIDSNGFAKFISDDSVITMSYENDRYHITKFNNLDKHLISETYNKESLLLTDHTKFILDVPIGIHQKYDNYGKLIYEFNHDKGFTYTMENLINDIRNNYNIDLFHDKNHLHSVSKFTMQKPAYKLILHKYGNNYKKIKISGINGTVLSEEDIELSE